MPRRLAALLICLTEGLSAPLAVVDYAPEP
jgi:hypothetical protein